MIFTHWPTDGQLGCFQFGSVIKKCCKVFLGKKDIFHLSNYLGVEFVGYRVGVYLTLEKTVRSFPNMVDHFIFSLTRYESSIGGVNFQRSGVCILRSC